MHDESYISALDDELMQQGYALHQRPFQVVARLVQDRGGGDVLAPDVWTRVNAVYARLYPSGDFGVGSLQIGGVAFRDQFYIARAHLGFGRVGIEPLKCIEVSPEELEILWRARPAEVWRAMYGVADLRDFAYGVRDLSGGDKAAVAMWSNAASHLQASALTLKSNRALEASVQSSCLAAELGLKGALAFLGADATKLFKLRHNLAAATEELVRRRPGNRDAEVVAAAGMFPEYVHSRYNPHGLSRIQLNELAMRAQFVAAEAVRRVSNRDLASAVEADLSSPARVFP